MKSVGGTEGVAKCHKCGNTSFDYSDRCRKCGAVHLSTTSNK